MSMIDETDSAMQRCAGCDRIAFEPKPTEAFGPVYCEECFEANDDEFPLPKRCSICTMYDLQDEITCIDDSFAHRSCRETGHRELVICERCGMSEHVLRDHLDGCHPPREYQWLSGFQVPGPSHGEHVFVKITVSSSSPALDAMRGAE